MTQRHQPLSQASWKRGVAALTLLSATLLSGTATAQIEETAPASTCGKFSYELVASGSRPSTPVKISLNGKSLKFTDTFASEKQAVTLQEKNRLQTTWKILKTYTAGTKVKAYSSEVTLRLINGNRVTNMFYLNTGHYPGKRELTYNFSLPPKGNIACAKENYTLKFRGASNEVVEWTVAVDGNYYLYRLSAASHNSSVDLRPFLKKGTNKVTLSWQVIVADGRGVLRDAAYISSDASGNTKRLLTVEPKAIIGQKGSQSVTITVK